jgi:hypothetical protein
MLSTLILPIAFLVTIPSQPSTQRAQNQNPANQNFDSIALYPDASQSGTPVCLKMRVYYFERNDGDAPRFVRETTCSTARPSLHKAKHPKARLIPAN